MRHLLAAALALLLLPGTAAAAEPASGAAARTSPMLVWTGATANSYFQYDAMERDPAADCRPRMCDGFRLDVPEGGVDLVVRVRLDAVARDGSNARAGVRVTRPDGLVAWQTGASGPATDLEATVRGAPAGTYAIEVVNTFVGGEQTYAASATVRFPAPAAPSAHVAMAVTAVNVGTSTYRNVSARFASTASLTEVTAVLSRGGRRVATARRTRVDGAGRVVLRARRRLEAGRYLLTVTGSDAAGRPVTAQSAVMVTAP